MGLHVYQILLIHKSFNDCNESDRDYHINPTNEISNNDSEPRGSEVKILITTDEAAVGKQVEESESQPILDKDALAFQSQLRNK